MDDSFCKSWAEKKIFVSIASKKHLQPKYIPKSLLRMVDRRADNYKSYVQEYDDLTIKQDVTPTGKGGFRFLNHSPELTDFEENQDRNGVVAVMLYRALWHWAGQRISGSKAKDGTTEWLNVLEEYSVSPGSDKLSALAQASHRHTGLRDLLRFEEIDTTLALLLPTSADTANFGPELLLVSDLLISERVKAHHQEATRQLLRQKLRPPAPRNENERERTKRRSAEEHQAVTLARALPRNPKSGIISHRKACIELALFLEKNPGSWVRESEQKQPLSAGATRARTQTREADKPQYEALLSEIHSYREPDRDE